MRVAADGEIGEGDDGTPPARFADLARRDGAAHRLRNLQIEEPRRVQRRVCTDPVFYTRGTTDPEQQVHDGRRIEDDHSPRSALMMTADYFESSTGSSRCSRSNHSRSVGCSARLRTSDSR